TGQVLQQINIGTVAGLARDGSMLYVINTSGILTVVDISSGTMVKEGSVDLSSASSFGFAKLTVGDGVAYVGAGVSDQRGGYLTVDVSDPNNPVLIESVDALNIAG